LISSGDAIGCLKTNLFVDALRNKDLYSPIFGSGRLWAAFSINSGDSLPNLRWVPKLFQIALFEAIEIDDETLQVFFSKIWI